MQVNHDIIDGSAGNMVRTIEDILATAQRARMAVGYLFPSGLEAIWQGLGNLREVRLLIGNTVNRETMEQISETFRHIELVHRAAEEAKYASRALTRETLSSTGDNLRDAISLMDQTDDAESLARLIVNMLTENRLRVRVYTKGRLHSKAYIFDYPANLRPETGIAIVGSSNLTLTQVTHKSDLNVVVHGNSNMAELTRWFDQLWGEARDFDDTLKRELQFSWALAPVTPYDIYMKTLYTLLKDRLEEGAAKEILWRNEIIETLADFQKVAVRHLIYMIRRYGGAFAADVVGTGKSFIGAAVLKHFATAEGAKPLIICPAGLTEMWEVYNARYMLNAQVFSMGLLREQDDNHVLLDDPRYQDRTFLVIDESHNYRNRDTQRYRVLQEFIQRGNRKVLLLTATPRNKSIWDVYNQIKLFHEEDTTDIPIDPPDLHEYFKRVQAMFDASYTSEAENAARELRSEAQNQFRHLLQQILYRRTRRDILKWYGYDSETNEKVDPTAFHQYVSGLRKAYVVINGRHQYFPKRQLDTIEYSIEETYQGLYQQIRAHLGKGQRHESSHNELTYARYGLWDYVMPDKKATPPYIQLRDSGRGMIGLIRTMLFKRFESSVFAFRQTVYRMLRAHKLFLGSLQRGIVPAGEDAQHILSSNLDAEEPALFDALEAASEAYPADGFNVIELERDIESDILRFRTILDLVSEERIPPEKDAKLQVLQSRLMSEPLRNGKVLIFTQYADTARYLYDNLSPAGRNMDSIIGHDKSRMSIVGRFAPRANSEYRFKRGEREIEVLVATDVLSEGLNLQDCDKMVNYDLHWNPVRLIQRFGRIDRVGSVNDLVWGFNFLPETALDRNLGLREKLRRRIQEIHDTIGEDAEVLDKTEELNEQAMYAIYEQNADQLSEYEDESDGIGLTEAEEMLRRMRREDPDEFDRIRSLRNGIRSARASTSKGFCVFCEAGQYQQLFLTDTDGHVISRDISKVISLLACTPAENTLSRPRAHNASVSKVRRLFEAEVEQRESGKQFSKPLTSGQKYVLQEMKNLFESASDEESKAQIDVLERAFRNCRRRSVIDELNTVRRNRVAGEALLRLLADIYHRHGLADAIPNERSAESVVPRIVCSEALL